QDPSVGPILAHRDDGPGAAFTVAVVGACPIPGMSYLSLQRSQGVLEACGPAHAGDRRRWPGARRDFGLDRGTDPLARGDSRAQRWRSPFLPRGPSAGAV